MADIKYAGLNTLSAFKDQADATYSLAGHTHKYAGSSSAGGAATSANKVNTNLVIKLNGGTTEGTNLFTFNGSAAKTVNITPAGIGAATSGHTHKTLTFNIDNGAAMSVPYDGSIAETIQVSAPGHTHNYAGSSSPGNAANSALFLNVNNTMQYGLHGVNYFNEWLNEGASPGTNDAPYGAWWHILRFNHANNDGYYTDLAFPLNETGMYYKRVGGGAVQDGGWVRVLDEKSYNSLIKKTVFYPYFGTQGYVIDHTHAQGYNYGVSPNQILRNDLLSYLNVNNTNYRFCESGHYKITLKLCVSNANSTAIEYLDMTSFSDPATVLYRTTGTGQGGVLQMVFYANAETDYSFMYSTSVADSGKSTWADARYCFCIIEKLT